MIPGFNFIKELGTMGNQLISKLFSWAQPVMQEVFDEVPTTDTLPDRHCALYKSGTVVRIYYNINGVLARFNSEGNFGDSGIHYNRSGGFAVSSAYLLFACVGATTLNIKMHTMHNNGHCYKEYSLVYSLHGKALSLIHENNAYAPANIALSFNTATGEISTPTLSYALSLTLDITVLHGDVTFDY